LVRKALRIPCYTIAANAGVDADDVVTRVMQDKDEIGYDALHDKYVDMMKSGIIDPTKVHTAPSIVCPRACLNNHMSIFHRPTIHVTCVCDSVILL